MTFGLQTAAYISATVLFILSLGGLSNQESAKRAVWYGIIGMAIAVAATIIGSNVAPSTMLIGSIVIGALIGAIRDKGADVWVVFDSCHSGTATRAAPSVDDEIRMRKLGPEALGIPADRMIAAEGTSRALPDPHDAPPAAVEMSATPVAKPGKLVAFFAAQTNETTPEKNMPKGKAGRRLQG